MHSVYVPLLWEKDHHHRHLTVQVTILRPTTTTTTTTTTTAQITMHPFSICATALGKIPPLPPSHSASYNITANHHYHHRHHLDHHSTNYNACIQYMRHCFRNKIRPPVQVTVGLVRHQHPSDHRLSQGVHAHSGGRLGPPAQVTEGHNYTTTIDVHDAASTCNLHKGMPLNFSPYPQFNGICPYASLHVLAASCTSMVVV